MEKVYIDYNSTTPIDPRVLEAMLPYLKDEYGNPSSIHSFGNSAKAALDSAREKVAELLNIRAKEIVFTGGGSESNNFAIKGIAYSLKEKGNHLITTETEHASSLETFKFLETEGFSVTYLPVDKYGLINLNRLIKSITNKTILISCIYVNNETGTINSTKEIGKIAYENGIIIHTDVVQALGKIPLNLGDFPVDLASISSHKIYGPKGVGAIYIRKGIEPVSLIHGGGQERGRRSGTENVAGIVGFGRACEIMKNESESEQKKVSALRDKLQEYIFNNIDGVHLNGHLEKRICNTLNVSFDDAEGESLVMNLDLEGIAVSTGSACSEGNVDPSHVLLAMGLSKKSAVSSLRFSLGRFSDDEDIEKTIDVLPNVIERIRNTKI